MKTQTRTVAVINDSKILVIENGKKMVPIKPICQALGIDFPRQKQKIEDDEILGLVVGLTPTTGADGKTYDMVCIPFKYVFGWLFTINPSNVKEEARQQVIQYKEKCYDVLYQSFTDMSDFLSEKQNSVSTLLEEQQTAKKNFNEANKRLKQAEKALNEAVGMSFDVWLANNRQMKIFVEGEEAIDD
jgi:hypothetical protein